MEWGFVVAADEGVEWLLSWWWNNYSKHQRQPVLFVDLGMSSGARTWCQERGLLAALPAADFVVPKERVHKRRQREWENIYGPTVWNARKSWFKKPLAMLQSPFKKTVWMDLDCEVCRPIEGIFHGISEECLGAVQVEEGHYNSGVVVYGHKAPLLKAWAEACLVENASSIGDEDLLSKLVGCQRYPFQEIARSYNWMMGWGYHPDLKIAHWAASWGKFCIETMGGIQGYFSQYGGEREEPEVFSQG